MSNNSRHVHIPHKSFLSTLVKNLKLRLVTVSFNLNSTANDRLADSSEYKLLLENMSVLMKEHWPYDTSGDFGTNQIRYLCERFGLEFEQNLSLFRSYLDSEGKYIPAGLVPLINVLKIIPISTAEDERGFSAMNIVSTDLRNSLTIENISAILFIKINGPPIAKFNSEKYVKNWLREHNHAESSHNTGREESKETIIKKCWKFL